MTTRQRWTMAAAILGSAIVFLDGTIVNVALPRIGQELPASLLGVLEGQTYVNSGFLAVLAALLILGGAISDRYGRKRVFSIGLIGFGATSVLCGLAPTLEALVLFRLLQGAAAALLVPGSLALITATFEGAALSRAFGIWASATSAATLFAPVVGGLLVQYVSWRVAFMMNVPLVLLALLGLARGEAESVRQGARGRFDWVGSFDVVLAVGGLTFGLIRGQQMAWADPVAWAAIGLGLVALALFPVLMSRRKDPLVPLDLFRNRRFAVINLSTFLIYGALYVFLAYSGIFVQGTLGYSVVAASVIGLPVGVILSVASTKVGGLAGRIGPRRFLVAGPLLMAAAMLWLARIPSTSEPWLADFARPATLLPPASTLIDILPTMILFGIGISLVVAPLTSTLMSSVPVTRAGLGSAINNAISRVGAPLIGALVFIAITASFYGSVAAATGTPADDPTLRETVSPLNPPPKSASPATVEAVKVASVDAFRLALLVNAGLLIFGAVANGLGLHGDDTMGRSDTATGDAPAG